MPRFYFNIRDYGGIAQDNEGNEFGGLAEALEEAKSVARELAKQYIDNRQPVAPACIDIADEDDIVVAALTVAEVIAHPDRPIFSARRLTAARMARTHGALADAEREHFARKLALANERRDLDRREAQEDKRWSVEEAELIAAIASSIARANKTSE